MLVLKESNHLFGFIILKGNLKELVRNLWQSRHALFIQKEPSNINNLCFLELHSSPG